MARAGDNRRSSVRDTADVDASGVVNQGGRVPHIATQHALRLPYPEHLDAAGGACPLCRRRVTQLDERGSQ